MKELNDEERAVYLAQQKVSHLGYASRGGSRAAGTALPHCSAPAQLGGSQDVKTQVHRMYSELMEEYDRVVSRLRDLR